MPLIGSGSIRIAIFILSPASNMARKWPVGKLQLAKRPTPKWATGALRPLAVRVRWYGMVRLRQKTQASKCRMVSSDYLRGDMVQEEQVVGATDAVPFAIPPLVVPPPELQCQSAGCRRLHRFQCHWCGKHVCLRHANSRCDTSLMPLCETC
jgi:hypothetical protein